MKRLDIGARSVIAKELYRRKREFTALQRKLEKEFPKNKNPFPKSRDPYAIMAWGATNFLDRHKKDPAQEEVLEDIRQAWRQMKTLQALAQIEKPYNFSILEYRGKKYILSPIEKAKIEKELDLGGPGYYDWELLKKRIVYDEKFLLKLKWYKNLIEITGELYGRLRETS